MISEEYRKAQLDGPEAPIGQGELRRAEPAS
jgi:hypothetical protein